MNELRLPKDLVNRFERRWAARLGQSWHQQQRPPSLSAHSTSSPPLSAPNGRQKCPGDAAGHIDGWLN
jgi:hypothetical protein